VPVGDKTVQLEIPDGVDPGDEFIVEVDLEGSPEPRDAEAVATSAVAAGPAGTDVELELSAVRDGDTVLVRATARPPEGTARTPTDVCMVVDVSGSMGAEATMLNADGAREAHGLSLLDITKHAVATVIETLGAADRFTLVAYSSAVKTPCAAVAMDAAGKQLARRQLEAAARARPHCRFVLPLIHVTPDSRTYSRTYFSDAAMRPGPRRCAPAGRRTCGRAWRRA
jgi:hypothetical protein